MGLVCSLWHYLGGLEPGICRVTWSKLNWSYFNGLGELRGNKFLVIK